MALGTAVGVLNSHGPNSQDNQQNFAAYTTSILSKSLFHPIPLEDALRTNQSKTPNEYQLLALDTMITPWLESIEVDDEFSMRNTILLGDEGGMGKTYSAALVASFYLSKNPKNSVLVLVPPKLIKQWTESFRELNINCFAPSNPRSFFQQGDFPEGTVIVISKYIPLYTAKTVRENLRSKLKSIDLCILDEGHEGMIAGGEDFDAKMLQSLQDVIHHVKKTLVLTATPIRSKFKDLIALLKSSLPPETHGSERGMLQEYAEPTQEWFDLLKNEWFPLLEKLREGTLTTDEIEELTKLAPRASVFIDEGSPIVEKLHIKLPEILADPIKRCRLAKDLHPVGKFFISTLRDDLGRQIAGSRFRKQTSHSHFFPSNNLYKELSSPYDVGFNKTIFKSCPLNANDTRYGKSFHALADEPLDTTVLQDAWESDPRLEKLKQLCYELREETELPSNAGMVVFCRWAGTVEALYDWANGNADFIVEKLIGMKIDPKQPHDYEKQRKHKRKMDNALKKMRDSSHLSNNDDKIPILICGDGGSVGLNMEWANRIVHWDIAYGSAEMISQKNWRLDRMLPNNNPGAVDPSFRVHYFINEESRSEIETTNKTHRRNRLFVGDRRYIANYDHMALIPINIEPLSFDWTEGSRLTKVTSVEMLRFWNFLEGAAQSISGVSEYLGHQFIKQSIGSVIPLQIDDTPSSIDDSNKLTDEFDEFLATLALSSPTERRSIQSLYGGHMKSKPLIRKYGPPNASNSSTTEILPFGTLQTKLHYWAESGVDLSQIGEYPMLVVCDEWLEFLQEIGESPVKIASHQGLLKLRMEDLEMWELLMKSYGTNAPSGLAVKSKNTEWRHISVGDLTDPSKPWERFFSLLANLQIEEGFHSMISETSLGHDKDEFLNSAEMDMVQIANILDDPERLARLGLSPRIAHYVQFSMNVPEAYKTDCFHPLIEITQNAEIRDKCPICHAKLIGEAHCSECQRSQSVKNNGIEFGWC